MPLTPFICPHAPPYGPSTPTRPSLHVSRVVGCLTGFLRGVEGENPPTFEQKSPSGPKCAHFVRVKSKPLSESGLESSICAQTFRTSSTNQYCNLTKYERKILTLGGDISIFRFWPHIFRVFFFLTIDNPDLQNPGFRFTKIDLSQPPDGVGSSYLDMLEVFMYVLRIFDEKYF